jgi:hypothetical protein
VAARFGPPLSGPLPKGLGKGAVGATLEPSCPFGPPTPPPPGPVRRWDAVAPCAGYAAWSGRAPRVPVPAGAVSPSLLLFFSSSPAPMRAGVAGRRPPPAFMAGLRSPGVLGTMSREAPPAADTWPRHGRWRRNGRRGCRHRASRSTGAKGAAAGRGGGAVGVVPCGGGGAFATESADGGCMGAEGAAAPLSL